MKTYVLDTSGLVRIFERAAGGERVEDILTQALSKSCDAVISAVNWGELGYTLTGLFGLQTSQGMRQSLLESGLRIITVTAERADRAGHIKSQFKIGYADCFGIEFAGDSPDHILVTADYGVKPVEQHITIEFLPSKLQS